MKRSSDDVEWESEPVHGALLGDVHLQVSVCREWKTPAPLPLGREQGREGKPWRNGPGGGGPANSPFFVPVPLIILRGCFFMEWKCRRSGWF